MNEPQKYNQAWFKQRALKGLRKLEDGVWDYSDSLLLYINSGAEMYEQLQETDTPYFRLVTKPEREYLQSIAKDIADMLPNGFDYIDLGPGTEHKEQFLFDELKKQSKSFTYIPVDISEYYLQLAKEHAEQQGIAVEPMQTSFEELPGQLLKRSNPRFVSLGLTFSNFAPRDILDLLAKIAGKNGWIFINAQMRDRVDMTALQQVYQNDAEHIADEKLRLLGLDPHTDVSPRVADDGFRVWCTVQKSNDLLRGIGINKGDRLIVFQSLRYTKEQLGQATAHFPTHTLLDTGTSFVATMLHTSD